MKYIFFAIMIGFSVISFADDDPEAAIQAKQYKAQSCIDNAANVCINTECPNSPDLNCQDNCKTNAEAKCKNENQ